MYQFVTARRKITLGHTVTYAGSSLSKCIISVRLLVLLTLCAHDTGISSGLYHLIPDFRFLRSILFSLQNNRI